MIDTMNAIKTINGDIYYGLPKDMVKHLKDTVRLVDSSFGETIVDLLPPAPELLKIKELVPFCDANDQLLGFALPNEIENLKKVIKDFKSILGLKNGTLSQVYNIDWLNDLQNFIDSLKTDPRYKKKADEIRTLESLQDILNQPENLEILQTDKNWSKFNWDHVKENLKFIMEIIVLICTIIDLPLKDFITLFQPSEKEKICLEYQINNVENAEIREVYLARGTLIVRQYPKDKGKVLAELPNGERICLANKQKGNQRWLEIHFKSENGEILTGYVAARFTRKIYLTTMY